MGVRVNTFDRKFNGIENFVGGKWFFKLEIGFGKLELEE
jgi:hypothetical protein